MRGCLMIFVFLVEMENLFYTPCDLMLSAQWVTVWLADFIVDKRLGFTFSLPHFHLGIWFKCWLVNNVSFSTQLKWCLSKKVVCVNFSRFVHLIWQNEIQSLIFQSLYSLRAYPFPYIFVNNVQQIRTCNVLISSKSHWIYWFS